MSAHCIYLAHPGQPPGPRTGGAPVVAGGGGDLLRIETSQGGDTGERTPHVTCALPGAGTPDTVIIRASNEGSLRLRKVLQSLRRPLLGPSPG